MKAICHLLPIGMVLISSAASAQETPSAGVNQTAQVYEYTVGHIRNGRR